MKKVLHKLTKKVTRGRQGNQPVAPRRITNDTVAEHREQILAGGRRFKYPMQYAKGTLVRNTILISLAAVILLLAVGWWQLYPAQNTSKFMYRATQIVPVPVATVDGAWVRYSDYLKRLRSALHYLESQDTVNFNTEDGRRQLDYQKRDALDESVNAAYVDKLADEQGITVSDKEVDDFIDSQIAASGRSLSREEFEASVIREFYDRNINEYRSFIREQLLRGKVSLAIDAAAKSRAEDLLRQLQAGANFTELAKAQSDDDITKANGGDVGFQRKDAQDPDGLIAAADQLQKDQSSGLIQTRSGYYIIKLTERRDTELRYQRLFVSLKELDDRLVTLRRDDKVREFIDVTEDTAPIQNTR